MEVKISPNLYQLLNIIDDDFYKKVYNVDLLKIYFNMIVKEIFKINNINSNIPFKTYRMKNKFGKYSNKENCIGFNYRYLEIFDQMMKSKNIFYIYKMVDTLIHEIRHYMQYSLNVQLDPFLKNFMECFKLATFQYRANHGAQNILEIDARYYCFNLFNHNPKTSKFVNSRWFNRQEEIRKNKNDFSLLDFINNLDENLIDKDIETQIYKDRLLLSYGSLLKNKTFSYNQNINKNHKFILKTNFSESEEIYHAIAPQFCESYLYSKIKKENETKIIRQVQEFTKIFRQKDNNGFNESEKF